MSMDKNMFPDNTGLLLVKTFFFFAQLFDTHFYRKIDDLLSPRLQYFHEVTISAGRIPGPIMESNCK